MQIEDIRGQGRANVPRQSHGRNKEEAVYRQLLEQEVDKALDTAEIADALEPSKNSSQTLSYFRELALSEIKSDSRTNRSSFKDYLTALRASHRAFPALSPTVHRMLATIAAIGMVLAFLRGGAGRGVTVDVPLSVTAIAVMILSALTPALLRTARSTRFPVPPVSRAKLHLYQSVLLTLGLAIMLAAATRSVAADDGTSSNDVRTEILLWSVPFVAAVAITFLRRRAEPDELRAGIKVPPLRISPAPPLTIIVGGLLTLATIFTISSGEDSELTVVRPDATIWFWSFLVLALVASYSGLTLSLQPKDYLLDNLNRAEGITRREIAAEDVLPFLRNAVNNFMPSHDTVFAAAEAPGLSEASDPLFEIPTEGKAKVDALLNSMPGGAIGLAGPRGSGKSTVITATCRSRRSDANTSLAVAVSAPVHYSAREFLLNLYVQLCRSALGDTDGSVAPVDALMARQASRIRLLSIFYGVIVLLAGVLVLSLSAADLVAPTVITGVLIVLVGLFFVLQAATRQVLGTNRPSHIAPSLHERAAEQLQEIHYQYKLGSAWEGAAKTPLGIEASVGQSREMARREMTFPEIVASMRNFLEVAAASGRVVVGIDELDKIESASAAVTFLNDIKGIFGVPNCYFLVSISEEAMSSFERRGLPFRDVFDSSLDEVVRLGPLTVDEAEDLLNRRVLSVPVPFKEFIYAFTGGFARDLIRAARALHAAASAERSRSISMEDAVRVMVGDDIERKMIAAAHSLRGDSTEWERSSVVEWCLEVAALREPTPDQLRVQVEKMSSAGRGSEETVRRGKPDVLTAALEMSAYVYFSLTLLELFSRTSLFSGRRAQDERRDIVERLAHGRGIFSTNVTVAWHLLSQIRSREGLTILEPMRVDGSVGVQ